MGRLSHKYGHGTSYTCVVRERFYVNIYDYMNLLGSLLPSGHLSHEHQDSGRIGELSKISLKKRVALRYDSMYHEAMTSALTKAAEDALATFRHHDALAIANRKKANAALGRFLDIISYGADGTSSGPLSNVPSCVRIWTRWLVDNGPTIRQDIAEATKTKFTERGTPHTLRWEDIEDGDGADIPENTIIRFKGIKEDGGRGAPPTIYALWSQRYEVLPKFGVGPERSPGTDTLLGVITPDQARSEWGLPPSDEWEELTMDDLYNADDGETQSNENGDSDGD
jgi:hypothetical protein